MRRPERRKGEAVNELEISGNQFQVGKVCGGKFGEPFGAGGNKKKRGRS
jgi:hypothetical protein